MKLNKYLKELGLRWEDLPGNYNPDLDYDCPASDPRNEEDEEGFCSYEFFSLDYTLELYIYSKLCYFREHYSMFGTPSCCLNYLNHNDDEQGGILWGRILDEMIEGFKLAILGKDETGEDRYKQEKARWLLMTYWHCLWF